MARGLALKETGAAPGLLTMVTFLDREWVLKVWELHRVACGSRVWHGDGDPPFTSTFSFSAGQCFASGTTCLPMQCPLPTECWEPPHYHVQSTSTHGHQGAPLPPAAAGGCGQGSTGSTEVHSSIQCWAQVIHVLFLGVYCNFLLAVLCLVVTKHTIMDADTFRLMCKKQRDWFVDVGKSGILPPSHLFSVSQGFLRRRGLWKHSGALLWTVSVRPVCDSSGRWS